jgi:hypothetical protein
MQTNRSVNEMGGNLPPEEHLLLDDNKYIADVLYDFKNAKQKDTQSKLLFKKRMFRETDETITEPQFVNLSYVQVQRIPWLQNLIWNPEQKNKINIQISIIFCFFSSILNNLFK